MNNRVQQIIKALSDYNVDAILIQKAVNRKYLSYFTGSTATLYISSSRQCLLTDFRYIEQATLQCPDFTIIDITQTGVLEGLQQLLLEDHIERLGFESQEVTYAQYQEYIQKLSIKELIPIENMVEDLRIIKDEVEISHIRKAAQIADAAFTHIIPFLIPGATEIQIALELEFYMRNNGAKELSFNTIAASGTNSSLPHAVPTHKPLSSGDFLTLDFGCVYEGYCSDMTRTVVIGKASEKQKEIYHTVLLAQQKSLESICAGKTGKQIDKVARDLIIQKGYGSYFGHGLGHGVGLLVHEEPRLSLTGEKILQPGMIVTVEPGIYVPGLGGVRIEDLVVVTAHGAEVLSHTSKELLEL